LGSVLLDGVITGGPTEIAPAPLKGLRLGLPRGYFWENLDAELAALLEAAPPVSTPAGARLVLVFERLLAGSRTSCRDAGRLSTARRAAGPSTPRWQFSADHHLAAPPSTVMCSCRRN